MKALPLATVRQHTRRALSYDDACRIANPADPYLANMALALSLHSWLNTETEWLRLEAALVILAGRRRKHARR